jgi:hypothetical protein
MVEIMDMQPVEVVKESTTDQKLERELNELRSKVRVPYLEPLPDCMADSRLYTLVLDLDETLIHFQ